MPVSKQRKKKVKRISGAAELSQLIRKTCKDFTEICSQCRTLIANVREIPTSWRTDFIERSFETPEDREYMFNLIDTFESSITEFESLIEGVKDRVAVVDQQRQTYSERKKTDPSAVRVREEAYYEDFDFVQTNCIVRSNEIVASMEDLTTIFIAYERETKNGK